MAIADLNVANADKDSGQSRMKDMDCVMFTGLTAPTRISKFIREYVNDATLDAALGNTNNPAAWTLPDKGLPAAWVHMIYFTGGVWYLFVNNHKPFNEVAGVPNHADNWPFNKLPVPGDANQG